MAYLSRVWLNPLRRDTRNALSNPRILHAAIEGVYPHSDATPLNSLAQWGDSPNGGVRERDRKLWRLETERAETSGGIIRAELLVLSAEQPSFEHIVDQFGFPNVPHGRPEIRHYGTLLEGVQYGREYAFRVRANPVSSTATPKKLTPNQESRLGAGATSRRPRGFRVAHRRPEDQIDWFLHRATADRWGFEVVRDEQAYSENDRDQALIRTFDNHALTFAKNQNRATGALPAKRSAPKVHLQSVVFEGVLRVLDTRRFQSSLLNGIGAGKAYGFGLLTLAPPPSISFGENAG